MEVGGACWDSAYAQRMLSPIAQVSVESNPWFLATHSPIAYRSGNREHQQEDLFRELFHTQARDYLAIVNGEPGSGKSQLINWLKLRFDSAVTNGQRSGLRAVLIRRRSGSLKDALQQLVDQLPGMHSYLEKIRAAIDFVAGDTANQRLYSEMYFCLDAAKELAPSSLKRLHEAFMDTNAMKHLCRTDGALDRNVKRLVETSDVNQRAALPPFVAADFQFPPNRNVGFDQDLKDRLEDDATLRSEAADWSNRWLRQAIAGLTGLKGHTLNEVFRDIRAELSRRGEALALFIEDVSTLSVLDEELVNALQPLNDEAMCPLVSVLGMTLDAYRRLPDNLTQRLNITLELTDSSSFRANSADGSEVDRFVGRYLNALRLGASGIQTLANDVLATDVIAHSACDGCPVKGSCFAAFSSVTVGNVEIGLYPMSSGSALRLLDGLVDERLPRTPRTLLQHVLAPMLRKTASQWRGRSIDLNVQPRMPHDMAEEEGRLLSGWNADQRGRMSYLVYYWTGKQTLREGAHEVATKLPWWDLPQFASSLPTRSDGGGLSGTGPTIPKLRQRSPQPIPETEELSADYTESMGRLNRWHLQNDPLRNDATFRKLLQSAIRNSLQREDFRTPSHRIQRMTTLSTSNIEIEGQVARPAVASRGRFIFSRGEETYTLLRTLLDFEFRGHNSWSYPGGEVARRQYGSWLSANTYRLIQSYGYGVSASDTAVSLAVRFLRVAYRICNRKDVPSDTGEAVQTLTSFAPNTYPCLSTDLQKLANDLPEKVTSIRNELMDELAVRQGTGGILYIDPRLIIENLGKDMDLIAFKWPEGAQQSEFPSIFALINSSEWKRLGEILQIERDALALKVQSLESILRHWSIPTDSVSEGAKDFLTSARAVVQALEATNRNLGSDGIQSQIRALTPSVVSKHVNNIAEAIMVVDKDAEGMLGLDTKEVSTSFALITSASQALIQTQASLASLLNNVVTAIDVEKAKSIAVETLARFEVSSQASTPSEENSQC